MFNNGIHVCFIDRTESHTERCLVYVWHRYCYIVSLVEVTDDSVGEIRVGIAVLIHQVIDEVEWFELVVRIVFPVVMVGIEIAHGDFAVVFVMELPLFLVLFCVLLEDGIPTVYLVKRPVKQVLLCLAIQTVLFRDFVLVSYLYAQDTGK